MMKKLTFILATFIFSYLSNAQGVYTSVVEGFDWGPSVSKVILHLDTTITEFEQTNFKVFSSRTKSDDTQTFLSQGERKIIASYVSNQNGGRVASGKFITLILEVAPTSQNASPFHYERGNKWVNYKMSILNSKSLKTWNIEADRILPLIDDFDLSGVFLMSNNKPLNYASYAPRSSQNEELKPLLIWLHGGGEGGTDPTIPLLANRAANYASEEIQKIFNGAYVLVPQSPTRWMDSGIENKSTRGEVDDIYFKELKKLVDQFVNENPTIDKNRIYVGGCSNGGYMSLKLLLEYPHYFAAGYISALAYFHTNLTEKQYEILKNTPLWFVHSKDDSTTKPEDTVVPIYNKLIRMGAEKVHFSFYDHVIDITNSYGGKSFFYPGHWSWIYVHANESKLDFDGNPVKVNNIPVNIMQWLSLQKNENLKP
jgi:predicted esterase